MVLAAVHAARPGVIRALYLDDVDLASRRGLTATLERLRIDCQLAEALATGFDPLHLAEVFSVGERTAIRYADNAPQLLGPFLTRRRGKA